MYNINHQPRGTEMNEQNIKYEIRENGGKFWVGHEDQNGEWYDADLNGFKTKKEAQIFINEVKNEL